MKKIRDYIFLHRRGIIVGLVEFIYLMAIVYFTPNPFPLNGAKEVFIFIVQLCVCAFPMYLFNVFMGMTDDDDKLARFILGIFKKKFNKENQ